MRSLHCLRSISVSRASVLNDAVLAASALAQGQLCNCKLHSAIQLLQTLHQANNTQHSPVPPTAHNNSLILTSLFSSRSRRQRKVSASTQHASSSAHVPKLQSNNSSTSAAARTQQSCKEGSSNSSSATPTGTSSISNNKSGVIIRHSLESKGHVIGPRQLAEPPAALPAATAAAQGKHNGLQGAVHAVYDDASSDEGPLEYFASDQDFQEPQLLLSAATLAKLFSGKGPQRRQTQSSAKPADVQTDIKLPGNTELAADQTANLQAVAVRGVSWLKPSLGERVTQQVTAAVQPAAAGYTAGLQQRGGATVDGEMDTQQAVKIIELAHQKALKKQMPMEALGSAITKALELAKLHPHLDASDLLHPAIVNMQLSFADERATRLKRLLPDTKLKAELLAKDPQEVSHKITRVITAFSSHLGMQPPPQLLSHAWTFVKALRVPDEQLAANLLGLVQLAGGNRQRARGLAQQYPGVLLSSSWPQMMGRVERLSAILQLSQEHGLEFALRYPFLLRSTSRLQHVQAVVEAAPTALGQPLELLLLSFTAHPQLFQYSSCSALAQKYQELDAAFGGAASSHALLALCAATSVRRAATASDVVDSIRTSASIVGCSCPAELLPLLVRPAGQQEQGQRQGPKAGTRIGYIATTASPVDQHRQPSATAVDSCCSVSLSEVTPYAVIFLQPAERLQERAAVLMHLWGLSSADVARIVRWTPQVLSRDPKTQQLKLMLLQRQLLGREPHPHDRMLAPEMTKMLKKSPLLPGLEVETCLSRLAALEAYLQLQHNVAQQLVLRLPSLLLLLRPERIQQAAANLQQAAGGVEKARKLVIEDPKVLLYLNRAKSGSFQAQLESLQRVLHAGQTTTSSSSSSRLTQQLNSVQPESQQAAMQLDDPTTAATATEGSAAAAAAGAAISAAAARAARMWIGDFGRKGVKATAGGAAWVQQHVRIGGQRVYYCSRYNSELKAAIAYDLLRLAALGAGAAVNLPGNVYLPEHVAAMADLVQDKYGITQEGQWRQQQQEEFAAAQHETIMLATVAAATARAVASGTVAESHGMTGVRKRDSQRWEMRSSLVYSKPNQYSRFFDTAAGAAVAFDLVKLALRGAGSAVNFPEQIYAPLEVEDMRRYLQYKQRYKQQQQQQRGDEEEAQGQHVQGSALNSVLAKPSVLPAEQQQQQQQQAIDPQQQQWQLLLQCLTTKTGRQLLGMSPETGLARLQFLAELLGTNQHQLLSHALKNDAYLYGVLALSNARVEETAVQLQQQLGLSTVQLQQLLRAVPRLLLYRSATLESKVDVLLPAFQHTFATAAAAAAVDAQQLEAVPDQAAAAADAGFMALQHAVLSAPWLLCLSAARVAWKLSVLQDCCSCSGDVAAQVKEALQEGTIGRWLLAGEPRYTKLQELLRSAQQQQQSSSSNGPQFQALVLSRMLRTGENKVLMIR